MACWMTGILGECLEADPARICHPCSYAELGETPEHLAQRTSHGTPKGKFYRELERQQAIDSRDNASKPRGRSRFE